MQTQTEAMRLTFGPQVMALITGSMPLIALVTPGMSASGTKSHFGIFELFDVSGENLRFCAGEEVPRPVFVNARWHSCRCLHVSRLVTQRSILLHRGRSVNRQDKLECRNATATTIQVKIDSRLA